MATLLVIGGTGFFGKSILDLFQCGGLEQWNVNRVIVLSRNSHRLEAEAPSLVTKKVELLSADIATIDYLPYADFVIHAAASTDVRNYISHPDEERQNIQAGTENYCRLARYYHEHSKIVYVSSGAVYGSQPASLMFLPEDYVNINLHEIPDEKNVYALAKRDAEKTIHALGLDGFYVSIARCFAFIGPWLPRNQHFAIGNFIDDGLHQRPITVKANHEVYRSYMYADDLVRWLMTIVDNANSNCPVFNVGSDEPILLGDLAILVAKFFGVEANVPVISCDVVDRYIPSINKARNQLGLSLEIDLLESVNRTVESIKTEKSLRYNI